MAIALLSVGLLGLLISLLGFNVSMKRKSVVLTQHEAEADPKSALCKAMRAHGNCIEYAPMLALMILALGLRSPLPSIFLSGVMLAAVGFRYLHAVGVLASESIYAANWMKFVGALGTYLSGIVMSVWLIYKATLLFT